MIKWLNSNSGAVIAFATVAYTLFTGLVVIATKRAVDEQRLTRLAQFRPVVSVDLDFDAERHILFFVLRNSGPSTARRVRLEINPPLTNPKNPELSLTNEMPLLRRGIDVMVPGKSLRTLLGIGGDFNLDGARHQVKVTYDDELANTYKEDFELDLEVLKGIVPSASKGVHSLVGEIERLNKKVEKIRMEPR